MGGRAVGGAPSGLSGECLAHDGVRGGWLGAVIHRLVGRGRMGVSPAPAGNILTLPTSKSSAGGCRRWSAASSSDIPPGYVTRAWFKYGDASME